MIEYTYFLEIIIYFFLINKHIKIKQKTLFSINPFSYNYFF